MSDQQDVVSRWMAPAERMKNHTGRLMLMFPDGSVCPNGVYTTMGAISWPTVMADGTIDGYACLLARHDESGSVYLTSERRHTVPDWIVGDDGKPDNSHPPLAPWLMRMWAQYGCRTYAFRWDRDTSRIYRRQLGEDPGVKPSPWFAQAEWLADADALALILTMDSAGRFKYRERGPFHVAFDLWREIRQASPVADRNRMPGAPDMGSPMPIAVEAVMAGLVALDRRRARTDTPGYRTGEFDPFNPFEIQVLGA